MLRKNEDQDNWILAIAKIQIFLTHLAALILFLFFILTDLIKQWNDLMHSFLS